MVCPKTMRRIPENYVPCVFLGQQGPIKASKCPAMGWDASPVLDEESSRSSMELNNSCIDKECQQWTEKRPTRPSKEVGDLKKTEQKTFLDLKKLIKLISDTEVSVCRSNASHKFRLQTDLNYNYNSKLYFSQFSHRCQ